jgi:hypothetical protein
MAQSTERGGPPERPGRRLSEFIANLVKDPKNPPEVVEITGFLGGAAESGRTRIYLDTTLQNYVEVMEDKILHVEPVERGQLGLSLIFVSADAQVFPREQPPRLDARTVFGGAVYQDYLNIPPGSRADIGVVHPRYLTINTCRPGCVESVDYCPPPSVWPHLCQEGGYSLHAACLLPSTPNDHPEMLPAADAGSQPGLLDPPADLRRRPAALRGDGSAGAGRPCRGRRFRAAAGRLSSHNPILAMSVVFLPVHHQVLHLHALPLLALRAATGANRRSGPDHRRVPNRGLRPGRRLHPAGMGRHGGLGSRHRLRRRLRSLRSVPARLLSFAGCGAISVPPLTGLGAPPSS